MNVTSSNKVYVFIDININFLSLYTDSESDMFPSV